MSEHKLLDVDAPVTDGSDFGEDRAPDDAGIRDCSRCDQPIEGKVFMFRRLALHEECLLEVLPALLQKVAAETDACGECGGPPRVDVDIRNTGYCSTEHYLQGSERREAELERLADEERHRLWREGAERVTAEREHQRARAAEDTANRYCRECWQEIGDVVCFLGDSTPLCSSCFEPRQHEWDRRRFLWWADGEPDDVPETARKYDVDAPGYDPFREKCECEVCGRTMVGKDGVCSPACRSRLRSIRRARARDSEIPDFTCEECGEEIRETVVLWSGVRCEPCFVTWKTAYDRESFERAADSPFRVLFHDPDDPDYSPFRGYRMDVRHCAGCGRPLRGADVCSDRCRYEASLLKRRVPEHDPQQCEVCDEMFVPKRSDARYCSSACRQKAHRERKAAS